MNTMFGSSLSPVVCKTGGGVMSCLCAYGGVQHGSCCVVFLFVFILCVLCCQFL